MKKTLFEVCIEHLGTDASPLDTAPDERGCVDSVTTILRKVYPHVPHMLSTIQFNAWLADSSNGWKRVTDDPQAEDILISPTEGNRIGHVGIYGRNKLIMSNNSKNGRWEYNYVPQTWLARYRDKLQLSVIRYRRVI